MLLAASILAAPIKRGESGPHITTDFADPSIFHDKDGTWYAFATQSIYDNTNIHVQIASSSDWSSWTLHQGQDALPNLPSWVNSSDPKVWAPDINQLDDGTFLLYFSATTNTAGNGAFHCVGTATSSSITGPYTPAPDPFACPTTQGGAIDASGFRDKDSSLYVLYKIDANSLGHGGSCGNSINPVLSTPILIQPVSSDGVTKVGGATQILTNDSDDGPLVEAPSLIRDAAGRYVLFFSSGCFDDGTYDTKYATSASPTGSFARGGTLLSSGSFGLSGPGGLDASFDAEHVLFHALSSADDGRRFLYTGTIGESGDSVSI
ncbi:glycosyl hydrolase [Delphinella strobiligena]|nr:glycosyl hydrolase [Delphinella strobiligena]